MTMAKRTRQATASGSFAIGLRRIATDIVCAGRRSSRRLSGGTRAMTITRKRRSRGRRRMYSPAMIAHCASSRRSSRYRTKSLRKVGGSETRSGKNASAGRLKIVGLREVVWVILDQFRTAVFRCCCRRGHVGNALALAIMSTAMLYARGADSGRASPSTGHITNDGTDDRCRYRAGSMQVRILSRLTELCWKAAPSAQDRETPEAYRRVIEHATANVEAAKTGRSSTPAPPAA